MHREASNGGIEPDVSERDDVRVPGSELGSPVKGRVSRSETSSGGTNSKRTPRNAKSVEFAAAPLRNCRCTICTTARLRRRLGL